MKGLPRNHTRIVVLTAVTVLLAGPLSGLVGAETGGVQTLEGSGTQEDPYVVTNATELQSINDDLDAHYVLGSDIDASGTKQWNGGEGFEPIGTPDSPFSGTFDGNGHVVQGLWIHLPHDDEVGMFGVSEGTVENVHLENAQVEGLFSTGTLVGLNNGDVRNASASGEITSSRDSILGGLVGYSESPNSSIRRSTSTVAVTNDDTFTGGLVGASNGEIVDSYALGDVSGEDGGGLVGRSGASRAVYSAGEVTAEDPDRDGGLAGWNQGSLVDAYWDVEATGQSEGVGMRTEGGTGLTTVEMTGEAARENLGGFDFETTWAVTDRYPVLRWQIADLRLGTDSEVVVVGNATGAQVDLDLIGERSVEVTSVADLSANDSAIVAIDEGNVTAEGVGQTPITASHAGESARTELVVISAEGISPIDASVGTSDVEAGETVTVEGTFRNVDENATSRDVDLLVEGESVSTANVSIDGASDGRHTFEWTPEAAGSYDLSVDGIEAGMVEVVDPATATESGSNEGSADEDSGQANTEDDDSVGSGGGGLLLPLAVVGVVAVGSIGVLVGRRL